jgi:hypothetical protein
LRVPLAAPAPAPGSAGSDDTSEAGVAEVAGREEVTMAQTLGRGSPTDGRRRYFASFFDFSLAFMLWKGEEYMRETCGGR